MSSLSPMQRQILKIVKQEKLVPEMHLQMAIPGDINYALQELVELRKIRRLSIDIGYKDTVKRVLCYCVAGYNYINFCFKERI